MKVFRSVILLFIGLLYFSINGTGCTTFVLSGNGKMLFFARSYDRDMRDAIVMINKRNVLKKARVSGRALEWQSKYGSITFNQYGRDFPIGGMNENGLVIEVMILPITADYVNNECLPAVNPAQWVQYQLDIAANVDEVIQNAMKVKVTDLWAPLHYLVSDSVNCAVIEYYNGEVHVYSGDSLGVYVGPTFVPVRASANSTYQESLDSLKRYEKFGGSLPLSDKPLYASLTELQDAKETSYTIQRFIKAAERARKIDADVPTALVNADTVYNALNYVAQPGEETKFQVVYDIRNKCVGWRNVYSTDTSLGVLAAPAHDMVYINSFDLDCSTPVQITNMQDTADHALNSQIPLVYNDFIDYDASYNQILVEEADTREIKLENQAHDYLSKFFPADFYKNETDQWWAEHFMRPQWYMYPENYTICGGDSLAIENNVFNLYLDLLRDPISKYISNSLKSQSHLKSSGSFKISSLDISAGYKASFDPFSFIEIQKFSQYHDPKYGVSFFNFSAKLAPITASIAPYLKVGCERYSFTSSVKFTGVTVDALSYIEFQNDNTNDQDPCTEQTPYSRCIKSMLLAPKVNSKPECWWICTYSYFDFDDIELDVQDIPVWKLSESLKKDFEKEQEKELKEDFETVISTALFLIINDVLANLCPICIE